MTKLIRNPKKCADKTYDLIIVGGGIYGIMLTYEATRRNLQPLLIEKNDFSHATSLNHLRTVHGGFRYLQSLDLHRFKESVNERKWFLKYFPQYVNPMPCMMPLYGKGIYRAPILKAGLILNDLLSCFRNVSIKKENHLPNGKIISKKQTLELFPNVDPEELKNSAVWYDANIEEYQRVMIELIKTAAASGASTLNYVEAKKLTKTKNNVTGILAIDLETKKEYQFNAPVVINAAGPWGRDIAETFDHDHEPLFKKRLLLWNILFNKEALSPYALGLMPEKGKGHTYFFHPWKNRLLVGTGEIVVQKSNSETTVPQKEIEKFINDLNKMSPHLNLTETNIQRIYSGILPAKENGKLANREIIFDHSANDGPKGLFSLSGVKFTTSRLVADKTLNKIFPGKTKIPHQQLLDQNKIEPLSLDYNWGPTGPETLKPLKKIVENESVVHLSDLILRRTSLGDHPERALKILPALKPLFDWDDQKWEDEVKLLEDKL